MLPQLVNSDWAYISQMIYRINMCTDYASFADTVLKQILTLIPYTKGICFQARKEEGIARLYNPYAINPKNTTFDEGRYFNGNYNARWAQYLYVPWSSVFRYSDIYSEDEWT